MIIETKCLNFTNRGITPQILLNMIELNNSSILISSLTSLLLSFNQLGDHGVCIITEYIHQLNTMTILDLGFNNISDYGVTILSLKLINHPNLQILYLSGNNITSIGCKHLASLIKDNNHLQKLYLAGNPLGIHGAEELSLALLSNTSLTTLDLTSTNLSQTGFSIICSSLGNEFNNICELTLVSLLKHIFLISYIIGK